ncbi:hypothetical protein SYNPS1DRAFT_21170 [Syncephalis pseudoplumigaleata]|uniref:Uncharacterized protein n=1 Tax=Syncephalis pseudoplumigaleata TaxID=1712513 RepID=A0A4P9Z3X8_9FUNG|nr:hypothetical protein SYNPS1DRAFT_21170 [Syncephalis pseudoplumigaleata]|eukprot:RKP27263.1 hypothetical protein SYNPS1DRAFT_21170 [Syncephalis pseudoplumigaleata]
MSADAVAAAASATVNISNQSKGYKITRRILYDDQSKRLEQPMPVAYGEKRVDSVHGAHGTLLYHISAENGETGHLELYILVGWDWEYSTFYFGLVECEGGDQAVWRTPHEFYGWFDRSSEKLLVNEQKNMLCWSVFDADRFALSVAFSGESATIDILIGDTTQHVTSRPLEL